MKFILFTLCFVFASEGFAAPPYMSDKEKFKNAKQILGIHDFMDREDAEEKFNDLKKQYKDQVLVLHPDRNPGNAYAAEQLVRLNKDWDSKRRAWEFIQNYYANNHEPENPGGEVQEEKKDSNFFRKKQKSSKSAESWVLTYDRAFNSEGAAGLFEALGFPKYIGPKDFFSYRSLSEEAYLGFRVFFKLRFHDLIKMDLDFLSNIKLIMEFNSPYKGAEYDGKDAWDLVLAVEILKKTKARALYISLLAEIAELHARGIKLSDSGMDVNEILFEGKDFIYTKRFKKPGIEMLYDVARLKDKSIFVFWEKYGDLIKQHGESSVSLSKEDRAIMNDTIREAMVEAVKVDPKAYFFPKEKPIIVKKIKEYLRSEKCGTLLQRIFKF